MREPGGKHNCQKPNLGTTKPQHNLNLVGFDPIITLHTPHHRHHTTRNCISNRNNDPRGLKLCRRHYQAKLTTIQHNFNPTTGGGGGDLQKSAKVCKSMQNHA